MHSIFKIILLFILFNIFNASTQNVSAQYFGRNKVLYENFDFKVAQTPHFDIHHYLNNEKVKDRLVKTTEQWYRIHQEVLRDTFKERNPFIMYSNHAHFQQTRAISGQIDVSTGGVTEALKNRVVMPFFDSHAQTDHVLGHELVHAFQFHLIRDSFSLNALNNLPLWMVEGMAEYMSTGYKDPNTAMWLRSAVAANKLPTLKDLTNRPDLYFPYRWGEAFWAYVTGRFGDDIIKRLFMETARRGYEGAIKFVLKMDEKEFSKQWQEELRRSYSPFQSTTSANAVGRNLIDKDRGGRLNVVPSISPNGQYVAFWSEKNLFSIDLFLAEANTGKVIRKLTSNSFNSHIDQYSSFESAVAWSPDGSQLAFVAFAKGRNRLIIVNTEGKIQQQIDIPGVPGFTNPTWSPDGSTIVVNGLVDGQSDLYAYNLNTKKVKQLTKDIYSDIQPSYSPDGKWIAFATDRLSPSVTGATHTYSHNIALYEVATGKITQLEFFKGANNLNPVFGPNNTIYFLSDRDGFRNMYSYNTNTSQLARLTNLFTGISGITVYSPAISVSRNTNQLVYSYYSDNTYNIYTANSTEFPTTSVSATDVNMQAAIMPPFNRIGKDIVQTRLETPPSLSLAQTTSKEVPYDPKFQLDYIGNTGVGIQTGGAMGTGLAGGVNGIFSDMLGNHQLFGALSLSGEIYDIGGQFAYLNQKKRLNWGASVSHIPFLTGAESLFIDSLQNNSGTNVPVLNYSVDLLRTFQDQLSLFASYPFSTIRRVEAGGSFARYYYRLDRYTDYYDPTGTMYIGNERSKLPTPEGFSFGQAYLAYVGDNSFFGVASPLSGHRFRFEASQYMGVVNLQNITGDYRQYLRLAPITFATRNMYVGRFGKDAESGVLPPLFIGYPTLIRGYSALDYAESPTQKNVTINDLIGSQMYVGNAEIRLPLSGPERLSTIKSRFLFTELNLFTDAGIAWGNNTGFNGQRINRDAKFIMSSGVSMRVNLFGYLVVEPFYAIPWQNGGLSNGTFGLNFVPGW